MTARAKTATVLGLVVALATVLTISGTRLAASQQAVLTARHTAETVPVQDPWAEFWDRLPKVDVALSAQQVTPPMGGRRWTLSARAVQDGENLYVEVEWPDASPERSVGAPQDFTDAVAVQFPSVPSTQVPAFCMGDPNATVNIWQWKAAWQADVLRGFQGGVVVRYPNAAVDSYPFHDDPLFYPGRYVGNPFSEVDRASAVDNLVAAGFGTLTPDPEPLVLGWGAWRDGTWRVVFARRLQVGREGNVDLGPDDWTNIAFAVWDGAAQERDGIKSVASFVALDLSPELMEPASRFPIWLPFVAFLVVWAAFAWIVQSDVPRRRGRA